MTNPTMSPIGNGWQLLAPEQPAERMRLLESASRWAEHTIPANLARWRDNPVRRVDAAAVSKTRREAHLGSD